MILMLVNKIYETIKNASDGFDAIYEDYIIDLVGLEGFDILRENKLLESCGVINGRRLYVLCAPSKTKGEKNDEQK